jgi:hypothetical protein
MCKLLIFQDKCNYLNIHCSTDNKTDALGNKRNHEAGGKEHSKSEPFIWLRSEIVYNADVYHAKYGLKHEILKIKDMYIQNKVLKIYLEGYVGYSDCQVVRSQRIPSVEILFQQNRHFQWDCN